MMKTNFSTVIIAMLSAFILLTSCNNDDEYTPVNATSQSCRILIECINSDGRNLVDDNGFVKNVTIEGNSSHSTIKFDVQTVNGRKYLAFDADLPDQKAMEWNSGRSEATGISKVTVRFNKQKTELRCMMKLKANRPPVTTGGSIVLEEVSCNNRSYRRASSNVTVSLHFDRNGKFN